MSYYSRRGRKTLVGVLCEERLWLRANVYTASVLRVDDLIDRNGQLRPQRVDDQVIDLEARIAEVAPETEALRTVFEEYCAEEAELVERGRQAAREAIILLH